MAPNEDLEVLEKGLRRLAPSLAAGARGVTRLQRLSGGASQEIWEFVLDRPEGPEALVLRRAPGRMAPSDRRTPLDVEARLMAAAAAHGVPAPPVRYVLDPIDGLGHGFIMGFVEGETLGGRIVKGAALAGARETLAHSCGEALARIHAMDPAAFPSLRTLSPAAVLAEWRAVYAESDWPRPVFALAFRWLGERCPPPPPTPRLVHGDFRNGNLMVGPDGLSAVLDWELTHVGDPMEDLGWICVNSWRFGVERLPVGGFGRREALWGGYEAAGGAPVDRERAHWWEVFGALRWGCMCAGMPKAFRGPDPTVERAVIARRASETEVDLMRLICGAGAG